MSARVLLIANNFPPVRGGSAVVYGNLARCAGDAMIVLAPRDSYEIGLPVIGWREHDRGRPYRVHRLRLLRTRLSFGSPRGLAKIAFQARDLAIRLRLLAMVLGLVATSGVRVVCVGELLASGWILRALHWLPGLRLVAYVHGEEITTEDGYDPGRRRTRRALRASDELIVVSRFTQAAVRRVMGEAPTRVSLVENGVDTRRYRPGPKAPDLVALHGLDGCFVFLSVCRLLEKKGIDQAIRAFAGLAATRPEARYLIVGAGPYEATLRGLIAASDLSDRIVLAGQVAEEELVDYYRLGDVFVMPNRELANGDTEGFGLVFLEANGCGVPVIAGRDGGSTDAVKHGVNGLIVDGRSVEEIEAAMRVLMDDGALRDRLRAQGLAAASQADWTEKTRAFLAICRAEG